MRTCRLLLVFVLCSIHVNGQRTRTTSDTPKEDRPAPRGRGKARFSTTEEFSTSVQQVQQAPSRRPPSSRTRTNTNESVRRSRPRTYSVEEVNNDSPIETFVRQSKPRVLTENKFDGPPITFEVPSTALPLIPVEELGFGSTARAILQARGETPPPKTTTPVVDEAYLLNNFGSTIRSLAAASRSYQQQRPILRAEVPILTRDDIPSEITRSDNVISSRSRSRSKPKEIERKLSTERTILEDFSRTEEPERIEELELVTEPILKLVEQDEEVLTNPVTSPPLTPIATTTAAPKRNGGRRTAPRTRSRIETREEDISVSPRSRQRARPINRKRIEDAEVAETVYRTSPLFAAETQSRTGRRIDTRVESVPLEPSAPRTRISSNPTGRRNEPTSSTEKAPRGRGRSRSESSSTTKASIRSRTSDDDTPTFSRRSSSAVTSGRKISRNEATERSQPVERVAPSRRGGRFLSEPITPQKSTPKAAQRARTRSTDTPPSIDESKLEVLPLFDRESQVVSKPVRGRPRSTRRLADHMHVSATENDVQIASKPAETSTVPTTTTTTTVKPIKQTVVSQVNQVVSKSSITRRKKVPKAKAMEILSRGNKKSEVKLTKKKGSEEEITEDDNYPEPFKALIQAKKIQEEARPNQTSSSRIVTTSQKPSVTPRSRPSGARTITTTAVPKKSLHRNINDVIDNEVASKSTPSTTLKPTRPRQLPKFSEKTRYKEKNSSTTPKPKKTYSTRAYTPKSDGGEHHSRRKVLRSTASPPSTTPLSTLIKNTKYSAKFVEKKSYNLEDSTTEKVFKVAGKSLPKEASLIQPLKKTSRYSSRYRGDTSTRSTVLKTTTSAPFYIPTIPTPAYVPTVPTVTPSATRVDDDGIVAVKDRDLGVEVISFVDDPTNAISSADLVNGEFLTTDKNLKLSPMVKEGTTEKPISIIERIINSITMISTTAAPNATASTPIAAGTTENSAILKLASKKPSTLTRPDVRTSSNIIETITSEKPTTIIEKIRSSLSAIQTNEVGTAPGEDDLSSTTPLSAVTHNKYSARFRGSTVGSELPAPQPLSTTSPLSVFDQIDQNQVLGKQTISHLLDILNGLVSTTPSSMVVVTPKSPTNQAGVFVSTTFAPQEPIEAVTFTTPLVNTDPSTVNTDLTTITTSTTTTFETTTEPLLTTAATTTTDLPPSVPPTFQVESNRMARLLENQRPNTDTLPPRVVITSTTSTPLTTTSTAQRLTSTPISVIPNREVTVPPSSTIPQTTQGTESTTLSSASSTMMQVASSTISEVTETVPPSLGEILNGRTVDAFNSLVRSEAPSTTTPNYKTLQINQYNEVLNIQDLINRSQGDVVYRWKPVTKNEYNRISKSTTQSVAQNEVSSPPSTTVTESTTLLSTTSERLLSSTTLEPTTTNKPSSTTTTAVPSTTTTTTIPTTTRRIETTTTTTTPPPTMTPASILPTIFTTLFPNFLNKGAVTTKRPRNEGFSNNILDGFEVLSTAGTTAQPTAVLAPTFSRISTTTPTTTTSTTTTTPPPTTTTTTTTPPPTTTTTTPPPPPSTTTTSRPTTTTLPNLSNKAETDKLFEELKKSGKFNNLDEEQKRNLMEIEKIEKEQAELLKQLSLLTTVFGKQNVRAPPALPTVGSGNSLANRIISMAMARSPSPAPTTISPSTTTTTTTTTKPPRKLPNSIQDQLLLTDVEDTTKKTTPSLEEVLKQYNLNGLTTKAPLTSTYGKTDEAILAAILKEHGIGPTTPKALGERVKEAGVFEEVPTTKKPKPKPASNTPRPVGGRLMQGLNWLLDMWDPPTTKRPAPRKPKAKAPPKNAADEELLTNQPTRITPMVTAAPVTKPSLSQDEIQGLIKQLEAVQNNPSAVDQLDFSKIKSLQTLINVNEGVQVTHTGQHGATSRATSRPPRLTSTTERDPLLAHINQRPRFSTVSTISVSNSLDDVDVETTSTTSRPRALPPVSLNPVPGIDDQGDSMIRSNLLTAAVNVTRAISSFLGSAIQGARMSFRSLIGSGSSTMGNIAQTSSAAAAG